MQNGEVRTEGGRTEGVPGRRCGAVRRMPQVCGVNVIALRFAALLKLR